MVARYKPLKPAKPSDISGSGAPEEDAREFIHSGCTILDCVLGGGWPIGRTSNIVGDKSTGKTLLAIEACANFDKSYKGGLIYYREAEAAFDAPYAAKLGLPLKKVDFGSKGLGTKWNTVEEIYDDLRNKVAAHQKSGKPGLYIIDSVDALTSEAARKREIGEGSYNLEKPRIIGQMFSELTSELQAARIALIAISQTRAKIGSFVRGDQLTRSGGRALDFYSSLIVWLTHLAMLTQTDKGIKRVTGVRIQANCKKNKIDAPHRRCIFKIRFGYGIEDVEAALDWMEEHKLIREHLGIPASAADSFLAGLDALEPEEYKARVAEVQAATVAAWKEIEARFEPTRRKYA